MCVSLVLSVGLRWTAVVCHRARVGADVSVRANVGTNIDKTVRVSVLVRVREIFCLNETSRLSVAVGAGARVVVTVVASSFNLHSPFGGVYEKCMEGR